MNRSAHSGVANSTASTPPPGSATMNDLGLVKPVDVFGEGIVIGIATVPTDGSMPASANCSVCLIDKYWRP
jgi:hypothetical protein